MHKKILCLLLLVLSVSCSKEVYTDQDALNAMRESQKTDVTIMMQDINAAASVDMSHFVIKHSQGKDIYETTSEGWVNLRLHQGDVILKVEKDGYPVVTAIITVGATNTVVMIPIFPDEQPSSGSISGMVTMSLLNDPVRDATVSVDMDVDEFLDSIFSGPSGGFAKYRPTAISYASKNLFQIARTDNAGNFQFSIPITPKELTYNLLVHEIEVGQDFYKGIGSMKTNGQNSHFIHIQLSPCE